MNLLIDIGRDPNAAPGMCGECPCRAGTNGFEISWCGVPIFGWQFNAGSGLRHAACLEAERAARLHALDTQPRPVVAAPPIPRDPFDGVPPCSRCRRIDCGEAGGCES